ncbi:MAG TPA: DUF433 domain-containing protein [Bryobacteraceae bacterium]|nr:DUF433 domain-containing protein [Bryobacteraceae bacterium]
MGLVPKEYVTLNQGAYRIAGTRVSLDSLVYLFREGMSAESMVESYPALTLEQVHGALAFYLANQKEIDQYLVEGQRAAEVQHRQSRQMNAELRLRSSNGRAVRVKFQADADLDGRVVRGLRRAAPEIDIRTAADAALARLEDPEVLLIAADAGRTRLVHFARFAAITRSPGVILLREAIPISTAIEELLLLECERC